MTTYHVLPTDDLLDHIAADDCTCGPRLEPVEADGRVCGFLAVHHSLDGREQQE